MHFKPGRPSLNACHRASFLSDGTYAQTATSTVQRRHPRRNTQALDIVSDESKLPVDERALYYLYSGRVKEAWDLDPSPRIKQRMIFNTGDWARLKDPTVSPLVLGVANNTLLRQARLAAFKSSRVVIMRSLLS